MKTARQMEAWRRCRLIGAKVRGAQVRGSMPDHPIWIAHENRLTKVKEAFALNGSQPLRIDAALAIYGVGVKTIDRGLALGLIDKRDRCAPRRKERFA